MKEINLFKIDRTITGKGAELARKAKVASFLLLIVYCLLVAGALSFWLILRKQNDQLLAKIKFQEERIKDLEPVESQQTFLKQRLSSLSSLLTEKTADYEDILTQLENFVPEGVILDQLDFTRQGELSCGGIAANAVVFGDFLDRLLADEELAEKVRLSSTSRQEDGSYNFSLFLDVRI